MVIYYYQYCLISRVKLRDTLYISGISGFYVAASHEASGPVEKSIGLGPRFEVGGTRIGTCKQVYDRRSRRRSISSMIHVKPCMPNRAAKHTPTWNLHGTHAQPWRNACLTRESNRYVLEGNEKRWNSFMLHCMAYCILDHQRSSLVGSSAKLRIYVFLTLTPEEFVKWKLEKKADSWNRFL